MCSGDFPATLPLAENTRIHSFPDRAHIDRTADFLGCEQAHTLLIDLMQTQFPSISVCLIPKTQSQTQPPSVFCPSFHLPAGHSMSLLISTSDVVPLSYASILQTAPATLSTNCTPSGHSAPDVQIT